MKNKKFSGIFALLFSVCLALTTFSFIGAKADGATPDAEKTVIAALKYELTDLYEGATEIVSVKKGDEDAVNGVDPDRDTSKVADYFYGTVKKDGETSTVEAGKDVIFNLTATPEYLVTLKAVDSGSEVQKTVKVNVVAKSDKTPAYNLDDKVVLDKVYEAFKAATVNSDKKLELPLEMWELLGDSADYPVSQVTAKVYVKNPNSGWSSSPSTSGKKSSSLKVTLSDVGVYRFYVLFSVRKYDPLDVKTYDEVTMEKDSEWKEFKPSNGATGFYSVDKDADGNETLKELKIPVFEYEYKPAADVKITEKITVRTGKVGMTYNSLSFTLENATKAVCEILYAPAGASEFKNVNEYTGKNAVAEIKDENSLKKYSSGSSVSFTPLAKGQFKVVCKAMGVNSELETVESTIINVKSEMVVRATENTAVRDFFKNNTTAVIFLGIALLCLIAIIVIACWKPKDGKPAAKVEDVKTAKKAEKVEEKATVEADDEVANKEAEAAPEVEEATEETVEETSEEAAEVTETTETETPAEEPATEAEGTAEEVKEEVGEQAVEAGEDAGNAAPAEESAEAPAETPAEAPANDAPKAE